MREGLPPVRLQRRAHASSMYPRDPDGKLCRLFVLVVTLTPGEIPAEAERCRQPGVAR